MPDKYKSPSVVPYLNALRQARVEGLDDSHVEVPTDIMVWLETELALKRKEGKVMPISDNQDYISFNDFYKARLER